MFVDDPRGWPIKDVRYRYQNYNTGWIETAKPLPTKLYLHRTVGATDSKQSIVLFNKALGDTYQVLSSLTRCKVFKLQLFLMGNLKPCFLYYCQSTKLPDFYSFIGNLCHNFFHLVYTRICGEIIRYLFYSQTDEWYWVKVVHRENNFYLNS